MLAEVIAVTTNELITSLRNTINYYSNSRPQLQTRALILTGGGADLQGFARALSEATTRMARTTGIRDPSRRTIGAVGSCDAGIDHRTRSLSRGRRVGLVELVVVGSVLVVERHPRAVIPVVHSSTHARSQSSMCRSRLHRPSKSERDVS